MPCFHPLDAYQTFEGDIHFYPKGTAGKGKTTAKAPNYRRELKLPCGRCIGCRLERSRQWAIRLMHEAQLHERTCFLTLTYDDDRYDSGGAASGPRPPRTPPGARSGAPDSLACQSGYTRDGVLVTSSVRRYETLNYGHCQRFMRRLRKQLAKRRGLAGKNVRFYMCGEYGEKLGRPHYHYCLFGEDFREDRYEWRTSNGNLLYRSPWLEELWPHGNAEIGDLTFESAAYVARYIMKKITGDMANDHYKRVCPETGEIYWLPPEFNVMSRRPGIGAEWMEKFRKDVYNTDSVVVRGMQCKPPRYYDKLLELVDAAAAEAIKEERAKGINHDDNTPERLAVRETVARARLNLKKRQLENEQ